jgi:hypothetical protein
VVAKKRSQSDDFQVWVFGILGIVAVVALLGSFFVLMPQNSYVDRDNAVGRAATLPPIDNDDGDLSIEYVQVGKLITEFPRIILEQVDATQVVIVDQLRGAAHTLALGDTFTAQGGTTITLVKIPLTEPANTQAGFFISEEFEACGELSEQNDVCRGSKACCSGSCVSLPTCAGVADGPVMTCGERQMYCCGGDLTFAKC